MRRCVCGRGLTGNSKLCAECRELHRRGYQRARWEGRDFTPEQIDARFERAKQAKRTGQPLPEGIRA